ncbi:hypothetical protein [Streptomyces luteogriseus]|uniref:hypothetical protein n=1 Tax=Streptomyces luteogriseus TaxID=68233 RepID=UPI00368934E3
MRGRHSITGARPGVQQRRVAALRERDATSPPRSSRTAFWNDVAGPERLDARSQLKHALAREDGEGQEAA